MFTFATNLDFFYFVCFGIFCHTIFYCFKITFSFFGQINHSSFNLPPLSTFCNKNNILLLLVLYPLQNMILFLVMSLACRIHHKLFQFLVALLLLFSDCILSCMRTRHFIGGTPYHRTIPAFFYMLG